MPFPKTRMRRLRATGALRGLVRETQLDASDFIYPLFLAEGLEGREPIWTMPGVAIGSPSMRRSVEAGDRRRELGIPAVILFGIPLRTRTPEGYRRLRRRGDRAGGDAGDQGRPTPSDLLVITDLCLCEYTDHGHCGVLRELAGGGVTALSIDNDTTLELLARTAVSQAARWAPTSSPPAT